MRLFGLIGYPLGHSFSKKYFTGKFEEEGITNCRYDLFPIPSIDELPGLLLANPSLEGLNVTIPYKKEVLPFLSASSIPEGLNACNCIRIRHGQLTGYNTDVVGFEQSLLPLLNKQHQQALVLGNGGAAESVIHVLKKLGIEYDVVSRQLHAGSTLTYRELTREIIEQHPLIINTTPVGTFPETGSCPAIPYEGITSRHLLYDLVYNPPLTLFLQKGKERGAQVKNGEEMLVLQAEESWNIWNRD
jgi:shikimate dehydrogenase